MLIEKNVNDLHPNDQEANCFRFSTTTIEFYSQPNDLISNVRYAIYQKIYLSFILSEETTGKSNPE